MRCDEDATTDTSQYESGYALPHVLQVYNVINEDYLYEAYNMVELYCETVAARIELLSCTRQCPPDLMPAVCAVLYAAPKMSVAELVQVQR